MARRPATPVALTALALVLGVVALGRRSLWLDEAFTVGVVGGSLREFVDDVPLNGGNMLLYYALMFGWIRIGLEEWILRLPSVLFAAATVPFTYGVARRLSSEWVATVATLLMVLSVPFLASAQEARSYPLFLLLVVAGWWLLVEAVQRASVGWWTAFVGVMVAATYAHFFAPFFFVAQLATLPALSGQRVPRVWVTGALTAFAVLSLPAVLLALAPSAVWPGWIPDLGRAEITELAEFFAGGREALLALPVLAAGATGGALAVREVLRRGRSTESWAASIPLLWLAVPVTLAVAVSLTVRPLSEGRYVLPALPAVALLAARGLERLNRRWRHLLLAVLLATAVPAVAGHYGEGVEDWRSASAYLFDRSHPDDAVLLLGGSRLMVEHYWRLADSPGDVATPIFPSGPWERTRRFYDQPTPEELDRLIADHDRVWVVDWTLERERPPDEPGAGGMRLTSTARFDGPVTVQLYERP